MKKQNNILLIYAASSDIATRLIQKLNEEIEKSVFICTYRNNIEKLQAIQMCNLNIMATYMVDLFNEEQIRLLLDDIEEKYGCPTDIMNFGANKFKYNKLKEFSYNELYEDIKVQSMPIIMFMNRFIRQIKTEKKDVHILFILSSVIESIPPKYLSQYTMAKYALQGLMMSLIAEYANTNIKINAISPHMIKTKFLSEIDTLLLNAAEKSIISIDDVIGEIMCIIKSDDLNGIIKVI